MKVDVLVFFEFFNKVVDNMVIEIFIIKVSIIVSC